LQSCDLLFVERLIHASEYPVFRPTQQLSSHHVPLR
jgi:hypothetical protein